MYCCQSRALACSFHLADAGENVGFASDGTGACVAEALGHSSNGAGIRQSAIPTLLQIDYAALALDEGSEGLQDRLSEAELAKAVSSGAVIRRAVVVEVAATGDYILYLRLSDRAGYACVAKRRPKDGPKAWGDFRTLHRMLHKQGHRDGICVFPEGHPILLRFGIGAELSA